MALFHHSVSEPPHAVTLTLQSELGSTGGCAHAVGGHAAVLARVPHLAAADLQRRRVVIVRHGELISLSQSLAVLQPRHLDGRGAGNATLEPDRLALRLLQTGDFLGEGRRRLGLWRRQDSGRIQKSNLI